MRQKASGIDFPTSRWPRLTQTQASWALLFCLSVSVPPSGDSGWFWVGWSIICWYSIKYPKAYLFLEYIANYLEGNVMWAPQRHVSKRKLTNLTSVHASWGCALNLPSRHFKSWTIYSSSRNCVIFKFSLLVFLCN